MDLLKTRHHHRKAQHAREQHLEVVPERVPLRLLPAVWVLRCARGQRRLCLSWYDRSLFFRLFLLFVSSTTASGRAGGLTVGVIYSVLTTSCVTVIGGGRGAVTVATAVVVAVVVTVVVVVAVAVVVEGGRAGHEGLRMAVRAMV